MTSFAEQFIKRTSFLPQMFISGFLSKGPHLLGIVPKTAFPGFFVVQTLKNLSRDCVLLLIREGLNAPQGLFE